MSNKKIISIIVIIAVLIISIFGYFISNNIKDTNNSEYYDNIGIDESLLNILYLDVGQGDSTLIRMNGQTMLIDAGNPSDGYYIAELLKSQGISKIDYLIGTHIDDDHIGGMYKIVEEIEVENLYMPYSTINKPSYTALKDSLTKNKNKDLKISEFDNLNEKYTLGNATWQVLHVDNSDPQDEAKLNDTSIVIKLEYGIKSYLFMGNASSKIENNLNPEQINVLKVAHHGSNQSTSQEFLDKIKPQYAIISVGENPYKHPDDRVLDRLKNIQVYRTDQDHTIWLTSNGQDINIKQLDYSLDGANRKISLESIFRYAFLNT